MKYSNGVGLVKGYKRVMPVEYSKNQILMEEFKRHLSLMKLFKAKILVKDLTLLKLARNSK
jgi:hypothetical protein